MGPVTWLGSCMHGDLNRMSGLEGRRSPWVKDGGGRRRTLDERDCQAFSPLPLANPVLEAHPGWWQETRGIVCEVRHLTVQPKVALNLQSCWFSLLSVEMSRVGIHTLLQGDVSMILHFILTSSASTSQLTAWLCSLFSQVLYLPPQTIWNPTGWTC